jgi:hypothetical protein
LVAVANRRHFDGDATDEPFGELQSKNENVNYSVTPSSLLTDANARRVPRCYVGQAMGRASGTSSNAGRSIFIETKEGSRVMRKTLVTLAIGATIAIGAGASPTPADARWRHHHPHHGFPVAPIVGGLAAGALIGAALAGQNSYAYEPVYFGPTCRVRRESFWDG